MAAPGRHHLSGGSRGVSYAASLGLSPVAWTRHRRRPTPDGSGETTLVRSGVLSAALADLLVASINADDIARDLANGSQPKQSLLA